MSQANHALFEAEKRRLQQVADDAMAAHAGITRDVIEERGRTRQWLVQARHKHF